MIMWIYTILRSCESSYKKINIYIQIWWMTFSRIIIYQSYYVLCKEIKTFNLLPAIWSSKKILKLKKLGNFYRDISQHEINEGDCNNEHNLSFSHQMIRFACANQKTIVIRVTIWSKNIYTEKYSFLHGIYIRGRLWYRSYRKINLRYISCDNNNNKFDWRRIPAYNHEFTLDVSHLKRWRVTLLVICHVNHQHRCTVP